MSSAMKDSGIPWIGEIPEDWGTNNIGNLYSNRNEKVSDTDFEPLSVTKLGIVPQLDTAAKTNDGDNRKLVKTGDFVINSRSDRRGSCGISTMDGSVSLINTVLSPRGQMNPVFYNWLFHTESFADEFYKWGHGIVDDLWTTRWQEMKRISIIVPPLSEQQEIADYLDRKCSGIDEMIALEEKIIGELKAYRQSVITEAVTKGLNPDVPMKDSGIEWIGKIPEGWNVSRLKSIGYLYSGLSGKSGDDFKVNAGDEYALFIPFTNIWNNFYVDKENLHKVKTMPMEKQNQVQYGDVLFLMSSEDYEGVGKTALLNFHSQVLYLNSFCKGLRIINPNVCSRYINYLLTSFPFRCIIMNMANGFIRINLRADKLGTCPILMPSLKEQKSIADYLDRKCSEIDSLISIKLSKIDSLKEYRKSVIYEYVTGKKTVGGHEKPEDRRTKPDM